MRAPRIYNQCTLCLIIYVAYRITAFRLKHVAHNIHADESCKWIHTHSHIHKHKHTMIRYKIAFANKVYWLTIMYGIANLRKIPNLRIDTERNWEECEK